MSSSMATRLPRAGVLAAVIAAGAFMFATATPAQAEDAPTCADNHLSGEPCQGADVAADPDRCLIKVWVDTASCEITVPAGNVSLTYSSRNFADQPSKAEATVTLIDKASGQTLTTGHFGPSQMPGPDLDRVPDCFESNVDEGVDHAVNGDVIGFAVWFSAFPWCENAVDSQFVTWTSGTNSGAVSVPGADGVICQVTGTHSELGAATAPAGETPNVSVPGVIGTSAPQKYNNVFSCGRS